MKRPSRRPQDKRRKIPPKKRPSHRVRSQTGGGAATAGGMEYQHRVAAWVAVLILAETSVSPPWGFPEAFPLKSLQCETNQPVDDLLVENQEGKRAFIQVKRTLNSSKVATSDFAKVIDQFVRQIHVGQQEGKPLDPITDRLVLVVGPEASNTIRNDLRRLLSRIPSFSLTQPLSKAPQNLAEKTVLHVLMRHLKRSWKAAFGTQPTDSEIRNLLALIQIQTLDVEQGGADETTAKGFLRKSILKDQSQAAAAWSKLINTCSVYAANHSGASRSILQQVLLVAGHDLQACRSYQDDISRLRARSQGIKSVLNDLSCLHVKGHSLRIQRESSDLLQQSAQQESLLVIGDPGAGKSGALYELVEGLEAGGHDVILLAADRIDSGSLGALRVELGLDHEVLEVLLEWPGARQGYLILDGLDAARDPRREATFRDLIRELLNTKSRWRVIASIRQFDLRHNHELQKLFRTSRPLSLPAHLVSAEFKAMHHLRIPLLNDDELTQLTRQSSDFDGLLRSAALEMRELLRVPFNLRLIADLLTEGLPLSELTPIRTQSELLERYWSKKVIGVDGQDFDREGILRQVCERMVSARTLRVSPADLNLAGLASHLNHLLSSQVLTYYQPVPDSPPDRSVLTYSHHVLFDYAVARLLLRHSPPTIAERLIQSPDLILVIRPSLTLHFLYLWRYERAAFWEQSLQLSGLERLPHIGKVLGPSVVAAEAKDITDIEPLHAALNSSDENIRKQAETILRYIVLSLFATPETDRRLSGPAAGPWSSLSDQVSQSLRESTVFSIRTLLWMLCEHPESFTPAEQNAAGAAARRLLEYAWARTPYNSDLVTRGICCVCRTFESDPNSSRALLSRALDENHLKQYAYIEARWLADEVKRLALVTPDFVKDIYQALFKHVEELDTPTPMGDSQILPLVSNRKQDFHHAQWRLSEAFPSFLESAPSQAAEALISIVKAYVIQHHRPYRGEWEEQSFTLEGHTATIRTDFSHTWDAGTVYQNEDAIKILNAFERYILKADEDGKSVIVSNLVDLIIRENRPAVLWRRLLLWGAKRPQSIGQKLKGLLKSAPLLVGMDTRGAAGTFLKAIFPDLTTDERTEVERVILGIPDLFSPEEREFGERKRDQLLVGLTATDLVVPEAVSLVTSLQAPQNREAEDRSTAVSVAPATGGETSATDHKRSEFQRLVADFEAAYKRPERDATTLDAMRASLLRLKQAVQSAGDEDGRMVKDAYHTLITGSTSIALIDGLSCEEPLGSAVKEILLEASTNPEPVPDSARDSQFHEHCGWSTPSPRLEGAEGLINLAVEQTCGTPEVLSAVERLSQDPVPSVRYQIARRINALYYSAHDVMWRIIERFSREEENRGVLQGLLIGTMSHLVRPHLDEIVRLIRIIFDRVQDGPGAREVRERCVHYFTDMYVWRGHPTCRDIVFSAVNSPARSFNEVHWANSRLRDPVTYGSTEQPEAEKDAVRNRALDLVLQIIQAVRTELRRIETDSALMESEQGKSDRNNLYHILHYVAQELYFASGAYEGGNKDNTLSPGQKRRFYLEASVHLDELAQVGLPSIAYNLIQTMVPFIEQDPAKVLIRITTAVSAGRPWGFQYEPLAASLVVSLVERYLAEYRGLFRESDECLQGLLKVLDIFAEAGWPAANRLIYRLDDLYR